MLGAFENHRFTYPLINSERAIDYANLICIRKNKGKWKVEVVLILKSMERRNYRLEQC
jgi:hypothetical protein